MKQKTYSIADKDKLNAIITEAEGRATARTITADSIAEVLDSVENRLGYPAKKYLKGVKVHFSNAEHFPNAYHYTPYCTKFDAIHNGKEWRIVAVYRAECPNRRADTHITLTEEAKAAVLKGLCDF